MNVGGLKVGQLASAFRPKSGKTALDISASKRNYKAQVNNLESIFTRKEVAPPASPMPKHKSRSKSAKQKVSKGLRKVKEKLKNFKPRVRSAPSDSESVLVGDDDAESSVHGTREISRRGNRKPGVRFHLITILLGILFICSAAALIFIPIVHVIASKYLWITFGGSSVTLVLSFIGMSAATATLLSLYVVFFKLREIRLKALDDWTMVICYAVSALVATITILISALHFHDVVEIFGEEFLELLQGYWMTPKFHTGMDVIQMDFHCCGFYSYEDWDKVDALEGYPLGFIPFSCCSIYILRPCVHENVPRIHELEGRNNGGVHDALDTELTIYPNGCKLPMENYYKTMLEWVIIISTSLLVVQVMMLLLLTFSRKAPGSEY